MTDERIDLRPLDPTTDAVGYDAAVRRIMDEAALPLARRRARRTPVGQVSQWWRPMLAMAATVLFAALGVLLRVQPAAGTDRAAGSVAEAMGIPPTVAAWMAGGETPTALDALRGYEVTP